jgi:hypothetical protein
VWSELIANTFAASPSAEYVRGHLKTIAKFSLAIGGWFARISWQMPAQLLTGKAISLFHDAAHS